MPDLRPLDVFAKDLFRGQTALVTGGGRGIGAQIALAFADLGANLVLAGRRGETLEKTAAQARSFGVSVLSVVTNIRDVAQVENLVNQANSSFGHIDILINNAGGQFPARPSAISDNGWRSVIDLNLNGTWNLCSRVGPGMVARKGGAIVNIVHIYSFERGAPPFVHSGAARAGVVSMTRSLAYYWGRHGVRINALAPGSIDTQGLHEEEYAKSDDADYSAKALLDIPAGRLGTVDEVAAMTVFLCSPAAGYINGSSLIADGGLYLDRWTPMMDPTMA